MNGIGGNCDLHSFSISRAASSNSEGHQAEAGEHLLGQGRPDRGPHQVLSQDILLFSYPLIRHKTELL